MSAFQRTGLLGCSSSPQSGRGPGAAPAGAGSWGGAGGPWAGCGEGRGSFWERAAAVGAVGAGPCSPGPRVCICLPRALRVPVSTGEIILCGIVCATGILLRVGTFVAKCLQKRRLLFFKLH